MLPTKVEIRHADEGDSEGRQLRRTSILVRHVTSIGAWDRPKLWWLFALAIVVLLGGMAIFGVAHDPSDETRRQARELRDQVESLERISELRPDLVSPTKVRETRRTLDQITRDAETPTSFYVLRGIGILVMLSGIVLLIVFAAVPAKFAVRIRAAGGEDETLETPDPRWRDRVLGAIGRAVDDAHKKA